MRLQIEFQGPGFVAVPNHVAAMVPDLLSAEALGVMVRLALLPAGSHWNVATVQKLLGVARHTWLRISRELRAVGALSDSALTGDDGRHRGRVLAICWPDAPVPVRAKTHRRSDFPTVGKPGRVGVEKPTVGKPHLRSSQDDVIIEENEHPRAGARAGANTKTGESAVPDGNGALSPGKKPMTRFERSAVLSGQTVIVSGRVIVAGSPEAEALRRVLRMGRS